MWIATTKIWAVKDSLKRVVDYASYPEKTEYSGLANALHYAKNDVKTELCATVPPVFPKCSCIDRMSSHACSGLQ